MIIFCLTIHFTNLNLFSGPERVNKRRPPTNRRKWSEEEISEIHKLFAHFLAKKITPRSSEIQKALKMSKKNNGVLHLCDHEKLKKKISWLNNRHKHVGVQ
jgi:hypothetical protein